MMRESGGRNKRKKGGKIEREKFDSPLLFSHDLVYLCTESASLRNEHDTINNIKSKIVNEIVNKYKIKDKMQTIENRSA